LPGAVIEDRRELRVVAAAPPTAVDDVRPFKIVGTGARKRRDPVRRGRTLVAGHALRPRATSRGT